MATNLFARNQVINAANCSVFAAIEVVEEGPIKDALRKAYKEMGVAFDLAFKQEVES